MDLSTTMVLVCLLSAVVIICLVSFYFRRCAERQLSLAASSRGGSEIRSMRTVARGLDPAIIATFATFLYWKVKELKIGQVVLECAVCLNEFEDEQPLRLLPECSHVFHRECIDQWLALHVTCPVCRINLVPRLGELSHVPEPSHDSNMLTIGCDSTQAQVIEKKHDELKHDLLPTIGNLPRSHSTGHSVAIRSVENNEKFTLRLPAEIRSLFLNPGSEALTSPNVVFPRETSPRKSFRSVSVGSTRELDYVDYEQFDSERRPGGWNFRFMRSFISRGGNDLTVVSEGIFRSVSSPLDHLFRRSNQNFGPGERSIDRLTLDVEGC